MKKMKKMKKEYDNSIEVSNEVKDDYIFISDSVGFSAKTPRELLYVKTDKEIKDEKGRDTFTTMKKGG